MPEIDYRELLKKYISMVCEAESVSFVRPDKSLSEEEYQALKLCDEEAEAEWKVANGVQ